MLCVLLISAQQNWSYFCHVEQIYNCQIYQYRAHIQSSYVAKLCRQVSARCRESIRHIRLKQTGMKTSSIWFSSQNTIIFLSLCELSLDVNEQWKAAHETTV